MELCKGPFQQGLNILIMLQVVLLADGVPLSAGVQACQSPGGAVCTRGHLMYGLSCRDGEQLRDKRVKSSKVLTDAKSE